jgi:hypothetical protein
MGRQLTKRIRCVTRILINNARAAKGLSRCLVSATNNCGSTGHRKTFIDVYKSIHLWPVDPQFVAVVRAKKDGPAATDSTAHDIGRLLCTILCTMSMIMILNSVKLALLRY